VNQRHRSRLVHGWVLSHRLCALQGDPGSHKCEAVAAALLLRDELPSPQSAAVAARTRTFLHTAVPAGCVGEWGQPQA